MPQMACAFSASSASVGTYGGLKMRTSTERLKRLNNGDARHATAGSTRIYLGGVRWVSVRNSTICGTLF
jgi:hypothetical protein